MSKVPIPSSEVADEMVAIPTAPELLWQGKVVRTQRERFEISEIATTREIVAHPGAVGVIAIDQLGNYGVVKQYRHAIRSYLIEPVAGLMDKPSENYLETAKRELLEEAGLVSEDWSHLIDLVVSPGGSTEVIRFYLAENCQESSKGRIWSSESEEKEMQFFWLTKDELTELIVSGGISNSPGIAAWSAAFMAIDSDRRKPAQMPWPLFEHLKQSGGIASLPIDLDDKDGKS